MKDYLFISPSLDGMISDDLIYFEGIHRPTNIFLLKDNAHISSSDKGVLNQYFDDINNLFLRKLSDFSLAEKIDNEAALKLQALLQEIIKVKGLLVYNT